MPSGEMLIFTLIGAAIGVALGSVVGAVMVRAAAHWGASLDVPFGQAYAISFFAALIELMIWGLLKAIDGGAAESTPALQALMLPACFLVQAGVLKSYLHVSFGKASLITLLMGAIYLGISVVIGGLVYGIFNS